MYKSRDLRIEVYFLHLHVHHPMARRILIAGGTGFLGRKICETAVARDLKVTSISRSGSDKLGKSEKWMDKVEFKKFDLIGAGSDELAGLVEGADAIVYSLGILLESSYYKTFLSGKNPVEGLSKVYSQWNRNPLKSVGESELTYETMNRDLAVKLATAANAITREQGKLPFAFVSAAGNFPGTPSAYFETKKHAEQAISSLPNLRPLLFRPGFLYDPSRTMSMPVAAVLKSLGVINSSLGNLVTPDLVRPLSTSVVAAAIVEALTSDQTQTIFTVNDIQRLAKDASKHA
ncbi:hypothetical protein V1512DRAFT_260132 [Lipomyces arxii]|uniref:uncharacterized protein n=1 Tax=Lipomyces arxii TaxID=56418 RepID=UPI0034CDF636